MFTIFFSLGATLVKTDPMISITPPYPIMILQNVEKAPYQNLDIEWIIFPGWVTLLATLFTIQMIPIVLASYLIFAAYCFFGSLVTVMFDISIFRQCIWLAIQMIMAAILVIPAVLIEPFWYEFQGLSLLLSAKICPGVLYIIWFCYHRMMTPLDDGTYRLELYDIIFVLSK